jgi:hypothetical protein
MNQCLGSWSEYMINLENKTNDDRKTSKETSYLFLEGEKICNKLQITLQEMNKFKSYWDNLEIDDYIDTELTSRKRRIGKFKLNFPEQNLIPLRGDHSFFQDKLINPLTGGRVRKFSGVEESFCSHHLLEKIIKHVLRYISTINYKSVEITTHLFRIEASDEKIGIPTPEGIHRDGHDYISQHLISRKNILGGVSGIYKAKEDKPIMHKQLYDTFDTIILNDKNYRHDVSPIFPVKNKQSGHRDMLIIDYNFKLSGDSSEPSN